jgi:hypothetical protein
VTTRRLIWILWPSFIVGGIAEVLFFTAFDPLDMMFLGYPITWSREAVYSVGFFVFWAICAASSTATCLLQLTSEKINR